MAGVVKSMDATLKSMNLEKVNGLTFLGDACQKQEEQWRGVFKRAVLGKQEGFAGRLVDPGAGCPGWL